jgi:hypothetical protein
VADAGGRSRHQRGLALELDFHAISPSLLTEISGADRATAIVHGRYQYPIKKRRTGRRLFNEIGD